MSFAKTITQVCKHLEKDDGIGNKFQLTETIAWMLFLKCVDREEKELAEQSEIGGEEYSPIISGTIEPGKNQSYPGTNFWNLFHVIYSQLCKKWREIAIWPK